MDDLAHIRELIAAANTARGGDAERRLETLFPISETLAVYGTLAPGQPNHHLVSPLGGTWTRGLVEGELLPAGWGAGLGYPGLRPRIDGDLVAVQVLTAPSLVGAWPMLDEFEGDEYQRVLVPVFSAERDRHLLTVANLYAARV